VHCPVELSQTLAVRSQEAVRILEPSRENTADISLCPSSSYCRPCPDNVWVHCPVELSQILAVPSKEAVTTIGKIFITKVRTAPAPMLLSDSNALSGKSSNAHPSIIREYDQGSQDNKVQTASRSNPTDAPFGSCNFWGSAPEMLCRYKSIKSIRGST